MMHAGERVEAGSLLGLEPLAAFDALASGRCELVHPKDSEQINAFAIAERDRLIRAMSAAAAGWIRRVV